MNSHFWVAVVAAIVNFAIGWAWYSKLFGKTWMHYMGIQNMPSPSDPEMKKMMTKSMIINFVTTFITTYFFYSIAVSIYGASAGLSSFIFLAIIIWVAFMMPLEIGKVLWEKKPWKLVLLNGGQQLVSLIVAGIVYVIWY
ncbi:DUF1761 domain-containing protein [Candidatus Parcubacteria bacterium]|nr:DUF1761 domain-containing protein [Candidatus Parcubacteria bacterium]